MEILTAVRRGCDIALVFDSMDGQRKRRRWYHRQDPEKELANATRPYVKDRCHEDDELDPAEEQRRFLKRILTTLALVRAQEERLLCDLQRPLTRETLC